MHGLKSKGRATLARSVLGGESQMFQDDEIKGMIRAEQHRGRKGTYDPEALEERKHRKQDIQALAREGNVEAFKLLLLSTLGVNENSEQFRRCLREFQNLVQSYQQQSRETF